MNFTDKFIFNLKAKDKMYQQREGGGFGIRVLTSGHKIWVFTYTFDGKRRQMNLGSYPDKGLADARTDYSAAYSILHDKRNPRDPQEERDQKHDADRKIREERRLALTVAALVAEYIEKHAKPIKRSWYEDERILNKDALVVWGKRKAADIKKRDVVLLLESIIERGSPGSANNNFKIIRKMFRFAVQRDILEHSPCDGVVMPAPLNRGDRVLNESEIKTLWNSLDTCHASLEVRTAIRLILVTAQRPGEVIGMHTSEIDGHWWTIPAERSKNKKAHRVYLTDTALKLVGDKVGEGFIFPCTDLKKDQAMGRLSISQAVGRNIAVPVLINGTPVFDATGKQVTENKLGVSDFTPHDLRRTAATSMSQLGFMDEIIDAVLNHTKQGIIRTYNLNRYDKEKQQALEAWERKLNSIISEKTSNVIPMVRKMA
ncbi:MAG: tyrosine-type recombinase/integrase [Proteobacteria bacterium]|nr:tyrosine-type recombinase/integrase [Pseudomonadota bacterium]